jgi:hypothetical protein
LRKLYFEIIIFIFKKTQEFLSFFFQMAEIVDSCCVPSSMAGQLTKPDKNNNTTANVDDG